MGVARVLVAAVLAVGVLAPCGGCGSKISEANYFKVQHGMTEEDVDELLGPAHGEEVSSVPASAATPSPFTRPATTSASTRPVARKVKSWTRERLTIRVVFEDGLVVSRSAVGLPFEGSPDEASPAPSSMPVR